MIHILEADSIMLQYDSRKVLSDIYLKCETGKITGLLGRNGNGKTSLMNMICGTLKGSSRSVRFDGEPLPEAFKRPDVLLYLPQYNFIPKELTLKRIFSDFNLDYAVFEKHFPEFQSKYTSSINNLSGGQRRLVEIYTVLKSASKFSMLDEPFSHLSPVMIEALIPLILEEKEYKGLLITDHMYRYIIELSDDLYILANGKTFLTKSNEEIEFLGYAKF